MCNFRWSRLTTHLQQGKGATNREDSDRLLNWEISKEGATTKWWMLGSVLVFIRGWLFSCARPRYLFYEEKTVMDYQRYLTKLCSTKPDAYVKGLPCQQLPVLNYYFVLWKKRVKTYIPWIHVPKFMTDQHLNILRQVFLFTEQRQLIDYAKTPI